MKSMCLLPLEACFDPQVAGGKAAGLAKLLRAGFRVPPGFCLTTTAYREFIQQAGIGHQLDWQRVAKLPPQDRATAVASSQMQLLAGGWPSWLLADLQAELNRYSLPDGSCWAVRSSATHEDTAEASCAGQYRTELGVTTAGIPPAIVRCWASLWEPRALEYLDRTAGVHAVPSMGVVIQTMVDARAAGVAFSLHPLTHHPHHVVINAVPGLAEPLVAGRMRPDEYVISADERGKPATVLRRHVVTKRSALRVGRDGLVIESLSASEAEQPALTDAEVFALAQIVKNVERVFQQPVDVEWAFSRNGLWLLLQARPISVSGRTDVLTDDMCDWSRANLKETLPELPSPLGMSFLKKFMEDFIVRHYRELGCTIPAGLSSVRVIQGRPYINVTLTQWCLKQLGGRPELVIEQMGGSGSVPPWLPAPLPPYRLARAALAMHRAIQRAAKRAPTWFVALKRTAQAEQEQVTADLPTHELLARLERWGRDLHEGECTFAIVSGVGQALHAFDRLLPRWLGPEWRSLLNAALQGQTTIISAKQIRWLLEIAEHACREDQARNVFLSPLWDPTSYRTQLSGSACLQELDRFLAEYGHRAIGESDLMSPRFGEDPSYVLEVIRAHVQLPPKETAEQLAARQEQNRITALAHIRRRFGRKYHRWVIFCWWYRRLCRAMALREGNRHALMHYAAATRHLALTLGRRMATEGRLSSPGDIFFLTLEEYKGLGKEPAADWQAVVAERRAARAAHQGSSVPDFVSSLSGLVPDGDEPSEGASVLRGISISTGTVEGIVRPLRMAADIKKVRRGDIVVTPVIDPGMAIVFGLAGGLIAEMGGTLSHGSIIAREYGIPAVVNVPHVMRLLTDGDRVILNATQGTVRKVRT